MHGNWLKVGLTHFLIGGFVNVFIGIVFHYSHTNMRTVGAGLEQNQNNAPRSRWQTHILEDTFDCFAKHHTHAPLISFLIRKLR